MTTALLNREKKQVHRTEHRNIVIKQAKTESYVNVQPELTESLYRFIRHLRACFPEDNFVIEGMAIKGDKVYIQYKIGSSMSEKHTELVDEQSVVARDLCVLNVRNARVVEQLDSVYQINL